jgi:2-phosphoglycerate kinase
VERAAAESKPVIVEGVHVLPGALDRNVRSGCVAVEALLVVEDAELHRGHFSLRRGARPAERYLDRFEDIRALQEHLAERARAAGVTVIDNGNVDETLTRLMALVLDAVAEAE